MPARRRTKSSRFLAHIIQAVSSLKESPGSTSKTILNYVKTHMRSSPRISAQSVNLRLQLRKALRHGVDNGFLRQQHGHYTLSRNDAGKARNGKKAAKPTTNVRTTNKRKLHDAAEVSEPESENTEDTASLSEDSDRTNDRSETVVRSERLFRNRERKQSKRDRRSGRSHKPDRMSVAKNPPHLASPTNQKLSTDCSGHAISFRRSCLSKPVLEDTEGNFGNQCANIEGPCDIKSEKQDEFFDPGSKQLN